MSRRSWQAVTLLFATVTMGFTAGVFVDWAATIVPGLATTDDRTYVGAHQALNHAIFNPSIMLTFTGAMVFTGVAAVLHLRGDGRTVFPWVGTAFGLYLVAFVITMAVHEPLNVIIRDAGDPAGIADPAALRDAFQESTWAAWHLVRTITTTAAFACLMWALVLHGRATADHAPRPARTAPAPPPGHRWTA